VTLRNYPITETMSFAVNILLLVDYFPPGWSLCWISQPEWSLLSNTFTDVWTRFCLSSVIGWTLLCWNQVTFKCLRWWWWHRSH